MSSAPPLFLLLPPSLPSLPLGTRRAGGRLGNRNYRETTLLEARPLPLLPSIIYIAEEPATGF